MRARDLTETLGNVAGVQGQMTSDAEVPPKIYKAAVVGPKE
jgi:hypothetical protein